MPPFNLAPIKIIYPLIDIEVKIYIELINLTKIHYRQEFIMCGQKSILIAAILVFAGSVEAGGQAQRPRQGMLKSPGNYQTAVTSNNTLASDLYGQLRNRSGSIFYSPYSLSSALAMTYAGAGGQTRTQMTKVLNVPLLSGSVIPPGRGRGQPQAPFMPPVRFLAEFGNLTKQLNQQGQKGNYQFIVANALWSQKGISWLTNFLKTIESYLEAELNEVDFVGDVEREKTRLAINAWVEIKPTRISPT